MPSLDLEVVANTSYAILLVSYLMRDILWLRVLTVISLGFEMPYYYFQAVPLWDGIGWDVAFVLINVYWIVLLGYERRPVRFTPEQKGLFEIALHRLHPRHARALFKHGRYRSVAPNEIILSQGQTMHEVALIAEGSVELQLNQKRLEVIGPGHFIGAAGFLEKDLSFPAVTTVTAIEPTRVLVWKRKELRKLIDGDSELMTAIEATMGLDIANLLIRAYHREASSTMPPGTNSDR